MKILSAGQIREADQYTIANEPVTSIDLMERAAKACFDWLDEEFDLSQGKIHIFCGTGNNGGDGLAIARMMHGHQYEVAVYVVALSDKYSDDFNINLNRLKEEQVDIVFLTAPQFEPVIAFTDIIIDAIFGSGLNRPVTGWLKDLLTLLNDIGSVKIAIDIPSGLFADDNTKNDWDAIFKADITLSFQNPKLAFVLEESSQYCGEWYVLDISLSAAFLEELSTPFNLLTIDDIRQVMMYRQRVSYKGTYGHALITAGSQGKMGAAVLSLRACLRAGAGLVTACVPQCGHDILQTAVPEAMVLLPGGKDVINDCPEDFKKYNVLAAGPGMGTGKKTVAVLEQMIEQFHGKMVLDADALNILSKHPRLLQKLPEGTILTPHVGEFRRLAGNWKNDQERLDLLRKFSKKNKVITVLKGPYTAICNINGEVYFNSTGNPGMATAGSGDVLTGIIAGLLARGYEMLTAACLGVYLHGLSGDICAMEYGEESIVAGDLVANLHQAFRIIEQPEA